MGLGQLKDATVGSIAVVFLASTWWQRWGIPIVPSSARSSMECIASLLL
jgi:hypothetical protein